MSVPKKIQNFLKHHKVEYDVIVHPESFSASRTAQAEHVPGKEFAKVVMVKSKGKDLMFVIPSTCVMDFFKVSASLGTQDVRIEEEAEFKRLFKDCETGAMPPLGKLYHLSCFVDDSLKKVPEVVFNAGSHKESIRLPAMDFFRVVKARFGDYSVPAAALPAKKEAKKAPAPAPAPEADDRCLLAFESYQHAIGETAGILYRTLERKGALNPASLQNESGIADSTLLNRALGWLAREDKILLRGSGKEFKISLAKA